MFEKDEWLEQMEKALKNGCSSVAYATLMQPLMWQRFAGKALILANTSYHCSLQ